MPHSGRSEASGDARAPAPLAGPELTRYSRHLLLPEIGDEGQRRLKAARVVVVGVGGLGCPAAIYLAAAGVGTIGLVDPDIVGLSNLQRQILFSASDEGRRKVDVATERLAAVNPHVKVERVPERLTAANALEVLGGFDLIVDGTDNFPTRYLISDASVLLHVPNVHGSVLRFEGRVSLFGTDDGPCYRCLFPTPPPPDLVPDCADAGVLGIVPGIVGLLQATEAIKWIVGTGEPLAGRLLLIDTLRSQFRSVSIRRNPGCPACGTGEIRELMDYDAFCAGGSSAANAVEALSPFELAGRLRAAGARQLLDVREPWEFGIAHIPGARLTPVGRLDEFLSELDPDCETILYCHRGTRSLAAARQLTEMGFSKVAHLEGGIERWCAEIDPALPRY